MARQDLVMCLKNALERGYDLEKAKKSLTNAGYSKQDIDEAANELSGKINVNVKKMPDVPKASFFPKLPKPPKR